MEEFWNSARGKMEDSRFIQAISYSPYTEFSSSWKEVKGRIQELTINGFYRYDKVMQPLFTNETVSKEVKDRLFDIYMHYLVELEYRNGVTDREKEIHAYMTELQDGFYGEEVRATYFTLTSKEQYTIAYLLMKQSNTRESIQKYSTGIVELLENGIVYKNRYNEKQLLIYVNNKKNEHDLNKIQMVDELFKPLEYETQVFWDNHFGVINEKQTMMIDEIELL